MSTKALVESNTRPRNGYDTALAEIAAKLQTPTEFYRKHIEKDDKVFFPSLRKVFSDEEDQAMLTEFWEFDQKMIQEKYKSVVEGLESLQWIPNITIHLTIYSLRLPLPGDCGCSMINTSLEYNIMMS